MKEKKIIEFARNKYGEGEFEHPFSVASFFKALSKEWVIGIFHDILEDGKVSNLELLNFLDEVNEAECMEYILVLTRSPEETYFEYIERVKTKGGAAKRVKIADLKHNLSRTETLKESLKKRYVKALKILKKDDNNE